jgi:hypothetical protein
VSSNISPADGVSEDVVVGTGDITSVGVATSLEITEQPLTIAREKAMTLEILLFI